MCTIYMRTSTKVDNITWRNDKHRDRDRQMDGRTDRQRKQNERKKERTKNDNRNNNNNNHKSERTEQVNFVHTNDMSSIFGPFFFIVVGEGDALCFIAAAAEPNIDEYHITKMTRHAARYSQRAQNTAFCFMCA